MKINFLFISIVAIFSLFSCEEDTTQDVMNQASKPAAITLLGDNPYFMGVGDAFVDQGVVVEGGELIDVVENISTTLSGTYFVEYIAKNPEGLITTVRRAVSTVVPQVSLPFVFQDGLYSCFYITPREGAQVTIKEVATGVIYCSDVFLGYYEQFKGYGPAYAAPVLLNHKGGGVWEPLETPISPWSPLTMYNIVITENSTSWNMAMDDGYNWGDNPFIGNLITE